MFPNDSISNTCGIGSGTSGDCATVPANHVWTILWASISGNDSANMRLKLNGIEVLTAYGATNNLQWFGNFKLTAGQKISWAKSNSGSYMTMPYLYVDRDLTNYAEGMTEKNYDILNFQTEISLLLSGIIIFFLVMIYIKKLFE